jgi:hypothetical protein
MSREMIVGGEHMVGHSHHDYDELMEMGADPPPRPHHPPPQARPAPRPPPPAHAPPPPHPAPHPAPYPPPYHDGYGHPSQHHGHYQEPHREPRRRRLVSEEPSHERQFPIGFAKEDIQPNDEEDIEVKPQVYFRGERLALPPSSARFWDIVDIKVGKDSQLAATGAMPGESFSAQAVGVRMELDTAKPGIVITLRVRNVDTEAHDFKAVMYGAVLE